MENNKLIDPLLFYRYDFCFNCSSPSIEGYDYNNREIYYKTILDQYLLNRRWEFRRPIMYFKCKNCNKEYYIKFIEKDNFPIPFTSKELFVNTFMDGYKEDRKKELI